MKKFCVFLTSLLIISFVLTSCTKGKNEEPPVASFTSDKTSGNAPLTVNFTSASTGTITSYSWNFGDGGTSTDHNPSHTYSNSGTFTVTLTVTGPGGSNASSKTITVTQAQAAPVSSFTSDKTSGNAPLTVNFTSTSTGTITSYSWSFGDGGTSTNQNPSHTFSSSGSYTVTLTVTGPGGSNSGSNTITVTQAQAAPVSSFTSDKTSGNAPLTVNFTSTSTGTITSYSWSFGDGGTSTNQNPSHTFSSSGSYTVTLTVTGPGGSNSSNNTITVAQAQTLTLTTTAITSITSTTAISGGNITNDGGSAVTARGVCWSTTANPTTANIKTSDGTGTGIFTSNITGLTANTTYHVRAYATNSTITAYGTGNDQIFTTSAAVVVPTAPSSLTANAINPTTVNLTWTDNSNNETGFEIQRQNPNNSNLWVVVTTIGPNVTNYSNTGLSETWPGYQVRAINASGSSAFSNIAYAPAKLRIINNLYSSTSSSGNDWGNLNTVIWVRIGPTQASVQQNGNTYERLTPYDAVASIGLVISPAYNSTSSWADFPVSTYGYGGNYYTYIQCGWWDLDINTFLWVKHASSVLCNNGTCCCIKGMYNTFTNHTSGYVVVTMTGLGFPEGSWNNTLK